jgi:cobalt/nickel transport system permease protein
MLLFVFATALTPNGHWETWGIYTIGLGMLVLISRVYIPTLMKRVAVELVFVGVVLLGTLFRLGGEVWWSWGWLQVTSEGVMVLGSVTLKALLSLVMVNLLVLTTSIADLLCGLVALQTPPLFVAIISAMYRYIGVLADEVTAMRQAALSRNLMVNRFWHRVVVGHMIGTLFIRTYERGDRIHQAMLARGYTGTPPAISLPNRGKADRIALTLMFFLTVLGQVIYWR